MRTSLPSSQKKRKGLVQEKPTGLALLMALVATLQPSALLNSMLIKSVLALLTKDYDKTGPNHRLETVRAEKHRPAVHPVVMS